MPFRQHMDVLSKSPAPAHGLAAQGWAASAKRGGLSLWLPFSLATQRESNSAAEGRRKLLLSNAVAPSKSIARKRAPTSAGDRPLLREVRCLPSQA
jgi:hypothetical protein